MSRVVLDLESQAIVQRHTQIQGSIYYKHCHSHAVHIQNISALNADLYNRLKLHVIERDLVYDEINK